MQTLFFIGIIFIVGALVERFSKKLYIPHVVGYLFAGLIIGPEVSALVPQSFVENSHVVTDLALSIIAVLAGASLKMSKLDGHAKEIVYITVFQSGITFICVSFGLLFAGGLFGFSDTQMIVTALILGGVATATDTATPLAMVHEYRSKGSFSSTLLAVVAADDAVSLMMYSIALTVGITFLHNDVYSVKNVMQTLSLIIYSAAFGAAAGFMNRVFEKLFAHHKGMETISTLGLIFIVYSMSAYWGLEPLLSAMVMGVVMTNISKEFDLVQEEIDNHLAEVIFMLFFIVSAMHLKLGALAYLPLAIMLYVALRIFGKLSGSYIGARFCNSAPNIRRYLGIALIPQAGVAIGLALSLQNQSGFETIAPTILNIVIATTLVHEIIGPFMTKYALKKSGDIQE